MRESLTYGSVRGALSNRRVYLNYFFESRVVDMILLMVKNENMKPLTRSYDPLEFGRGLWLIFY